MLYFCLVFDFINELMNGFNCLMIHNNNNNNNNKNKETLF
jgi:hypothetical protein